MNTWPIEYYVREGWQWAGLGDATWTLCATGALLLVASALATLVQKSLRLIYDKITR